MPLVSAALIIGSVVVDAYLAFTIANTTRAKAKYMYISYIQRTIVYRSNTSVLHHLSDPVDAGTIFLLSVVNST